MFEIKSVGQSDDLHSVVSLLGKLAIFEKMERDFQPDISAYRRQVAYAANPWLYINLAYEGQRPVGVVVFYIGEYSSFTSSWRVYLEDVFVLESHRGRGLLRQLLQSVARKAQALSITEISLSVLNWNVNAIAAYKRLGAVETGYKIAEDGVKWLTMAFRGDSLVALAS